MGGGGQPGAQVRFCSDRFFPTGDLRYRGFRGAEGWDTVQLYKHTHIVILRYC